MAKIGPTVRRSRRRKVALAFPKERRIRNPEHLKFVRRQPCLVCGRRPTHAHHVRFAQARALGLKVSDEFTVPLCSVHHDAVHKTGDERTWWARRAIDPLKVAADLWVVSMARRPDKSDERANDDTPDPPLPEETTAEIAREAGTAENSSGQ